MKYQEEIKELRLAYRDLEKISWHAKFLRRKHVYTAARRLLKATRVVSQLIEHGGLDDPKFASEANIADALLEKFQVFIQGK